MAKELSKRAAQELLTELAELANERAQLEEQRAEKLAPITKRYQNACAPIEEEFNPQFAKLDERVTAIKKQVGDYLKAGFDATTGTAKVTQLVGEPSEGKEQVAGLKVGTRREISAETFCREVKERTKDFWQCLTVGLEKAEKFIGANRVNAMAKTKYSANVTFELREAAEVEE